MPDLRRVLLTAALSAGVLIASAPFVAARAQTPDTLARPFDPSADTLSIDPFADSLARPAAPVAVVVGRVTAGNAPVGGAAVLVPGTLAATVTDAEGVFVLDVDLDVGVDGLTGGEVRVEVLIEVRFAGYRLWQRQLALTSGDTVHVEATLVRLPFWARLRVFGERLRFGTSAREAFGTARRIAAEPRPEESETSALPPVLLDAPARTLAALAALAPSVFRDDRTDSLDVRGSGMPRTALDGVLLPRGTVLPLDLVEWVEVRPGALAAGDAAGRGGLLSVTSRHGDGAPALRIDTRGAGVTGRDAGFPVAGTTAIGGRAEGAFVRSRLRLVVGLRTMRTNDPSPSARALPRLTDAALARLRATPQLLRIDDGTASGRLIPLPVVPPGATLASALPPGTRFPASMEMEPRLVDAWQTLTDADLTTSPVRPGAEVRRDESFVRAGLALPFGVDLDLLRAAVTTGAAIPTAAASLFAPGDARARETSRHTRTGLATRRFGTDIALTLARTTLARTDFRDGSGRDVRATFAYADIDDPRNTTAAAYRTVRFTPPAGSPPDPLDPAAYTVDRLYSDRALPSGLGAAGLFALPGALTTGYARHDLAATVVRLDLGRRVRARGSDGHRIGAGIEHERTTERAFVLPVSMLRLLAQRAADGNVDFGGAGDARYEDVPYEVFAGQTSFVGYSYNGLARSNGGGGVDEVVVALTCGADAPCTNGPGEAPARATRTGAWLSDRLTAGPLAVDAGLRFDVFARGGVAFADPYATLSVVRAGEAGLARGPVDADWVPYYNGSTVTGYRDRAGRFYDGTGAPVFPNEVITNMSVRPRLASSTLLPDARSLRRPRAHLVWQPRIAASLALGADASLFASLASTAEAASPLDAHLSAMQVLSATRGSSTLPNPDLAPVRATTGGVGGRIGAGRLAVSLDLWGRRESGLPEPVWRRNVFPSNYQTQTSTEVARHVGADVAAELMAGPRVRLQTAYSLQHTFATVLDRGARLNARPSDYGDVRRHRVLLRLRAHTAPRAGPSLFGRHPLGGWAVDAVYDAASGTPYVAFETPVQIDETRLLSFGGIGTTPWTHRLDLGIARTLARIGGGRVALTARGENVLGRRNVRRVWAATGAPDDDGFLQTPAGTQIYPPGSPTERLYRIRTIDPMAYGRAREITVGLRWTR